jgi:hypothetical protein
MLSDGVRRRVPLRQLLRHPQRVCALSPTVRTCRVDRLRTTVAPGLRTRCVLVAWCVLATATAASALTAAPRQVPANDDVADATTIAQLPFSDTVSTLDATDEADEVPSGCADAASGERAVWYRFASPTGGVFVFDTEGSRSADGAFDTVLSVWSGAGSHPLSEDLCNDDTGPRMVWSRAVVRTQPGQTYFVKAGGRSGATGMIAFHARAAGNVPPNDNLADARGIGRMPYTDRQDTTDATDEPGEVGSACADPDRPEGGIWYALAAGVAGDIVMDTVGSTSGEADLDTVLSVWTGRSGHPLTEFECNDDVAGHTWSRLSFHADAGERYYIKVGGQFGQTGVIALGTRGAGDAPDNDNLSGAMAVSVLPFGDSRSNVAATDETGEVRASCTGGTAPERGLWYRYVATASERLAVDTAGSDLAVTPVVSLWTGGATHPLTEVACARADAVSSGPLLIDVVAGRTYLFKIGSTGDAAGTLEFGIVRAARPPNDDLADALAIAALPFADGQDLSWAGDEVGETRASCGEGSEPERAVWYRYVPGEAGRVVVTVDGSAVTTVVSTWADGTGHPLAEQACAVLASGSGAPERLELDALPGRAVLLKVGAYRGGRGVVALQVQSRPAPPDNDDLVNAIAIEGDVFSDRRDTRWGTDEPDETSSSCLVPGGGAPERGVWYRYAASEGAEVRLSTSGSGFDTVLSVWTGEAGHPLQELVCNDDAGGRWSEVTFRATAGATYFVKAGGQAGAAGDLVLHTSDQAVYLPIMER